MGQLQDASVLDLFCGTGSLGLEAFSQGAKHITFVDQSFKSLEILKANLQVLAVPAKNFRIVKQEALQFLSRCTQKFDLILVDPHFTEQMGAEVMLALSESQVFGPQTVIAIETSKKEDFGVAFGRLQCARQKKFGDKTLSFFALKMES